MVTARSRVGGRSTATVWQHVATDCLPCPHVDLLPTMLRPQDGPTRERKSLNGLWRFRLDPDGAGRDDGWWRAPLADATDMPVPASYNDVLADPAVRDHVGDAWYQTVARVPRGWAGQRVVLRFDSATHRAVVWVDDTEVARHEGGYTPFEADVTEHVRPGEEVRVSVVVDNRLTWRSVPPGIVENGRQTYFHDFFNYAGLHRSVWLYSTPTTYVRDITVVTGLEGSRGTVDHRVETAGDAGVQVVLLDATGAEVTRGTGAAGRLVVDDVHPWRPGEGYLYDLRVELLDGPELSTATRCRSACAPSRCGAPASWSTATPSTSPVS